MMNLEGSTLLSQEEGGLTVTESEDHMHTCHWLTASKKDAALSFCPLGSFLMNLGLKPKNENLHLVLVDRSVAARVSRPS